MKITSYPPLIILLDVLFIFLFILVLNRNKGVIEIHIPEDKLFSEAKIVYFNEETESYFGLDGSEYQFNSIYNLLLDKCKKQMECIKAKQKFGENIYILLPKKLFSKMSKISMLAFGTRYCNRLDFFINENGELDSKKLIEKNSCLLKIRGFK